MTVGRKINNLFNQANNIIKQRLNEANNLEEKVAKLEAVSGFDIDTLTKLFLRGYTIKMEDKYYM